MVLTSSERKNKAEKDEQVKLSRLRYQEMERSACLGEILSGVAHEINNPLQIILGKAQILSMRVSKAQDLTKSIEDLKAIEKSAQRIAELINSLNDLTLQKKEERSFQTDVDLLYLLGSMLPLLKACLKDKKIELNLILPEKLPKVKGDPLELKRLLLFLTLNAKQRMSWGGKLELSLKKGESCLEVELNDQAGKAFEKICPSTETSASLSKDKKLDFGLLSSQQILQEHEGELKIRENPGKGNSLTMQLPII